MPPPMTAVHRIDVLPLHAAADPHLHHDASLLGLGHLGELRRSRYYLLRGDLDQAALAVIGSRLLSDPVVERWSVTPPPAQGRRVIEVQRKPGVMDPVEASVIKGARDLGVHVQSVRVGTRVEVTQGERADLERLAWRCLANQAIEEVAIDPTEAVRLRAPGGEAGHARREVPLSTLNDAALMKLSQDGCLSLTLDEMHAVQNYFRERGREPVDVELETIAQTWSEHCVHKTLKGLVEYTSPEGTVIIDNLLKQTIAKATKELNHAWCWSVFVDNSGVIEFDDKTGVCLKVETHNRPSAIEPYGGANTGLGGVIRDILGTGVGAKPIFNTDVFCFGDLETRNEDLPPGTIHPRRLMKGVVSGVRDYGNRMGIPTVNGAIRFDPRYVGNPLVFCGTAGLIPKHRIHKGAQIGDRIVVIGGRTGRDGIHGATFSSVELHDKSEIVSSGAVQIGNAIEEKRTMDVVLQVRDAGLFTALTDCGAGGLSSACGEMAAEHGCRVYLDRIPLKYEGLSYCEVWISESQERMVGSVRAEDMAKVLAICAAEDVEAVDLGDITDTKRLELFYRGEQVADVEMAFLHDGVPRLKRPAVWKPAVETAAVYAMPQDLAAILRTVLARPNIASKEWVIRQYDHEVQAGSVVKPLVGVAHDGPSDAAVVAPVPGSNRGVAVACGLNTNYSDIDAHAAASAGIEEALRNLVCVGAGIDRVAILDNFSWSKCTDPVVFGALVRACQACYDLAKYYGTPFISGKDSLSNEFVAAGKVIRIPHTLLITAMTVMSDVRKAITMDLKRAGDQVIVVGLTRDELGQSEYLAAINGSGGLVPRLDKQLSLPVLRAVAACTASELVNAAHDVSEGGLAVTLAEMAFSGGLGLDIDADAIPSDGALSLDRVLFSESLSRIVITVSAERIGQALALLRTVPHARIGTVTTGERLSISGRGGSLIADTAGLKDAWKGGLRL